MEFEWRCPECPYYVHKPSRQALGLARSNHLRKHARRQSARPPRVMPMNRTWTLELQESGVMKRHAEVLKIPLSKGQEDKLDGLVLEIIKKEEEIDLRGGCQFCVIGGELLDFPDFDLSPNDIRKSLNRLRNKGQIEVVGGTLWRTTRKA